MVGGLHPLLIPGDDLLRTLPPKSGDHSSLGPLFLDDPVVIMDGTEKIKKEGGMA